MLKHHQLIKQTTRRSVIFQELIVHVGDFSCIKKDTIGAEGAGPNVFFRSSGIAGIGYFWANITGDELLLNFGAKFQR